MQKYNPTIKTDDFAHLVGLLHFTISKYDPNAKYIFIEVSPVVRITYRTLEERVLSPCSLRKS